MEILGVRFWHVPEQVDKENDSKPHIVAQSGFITKGRTA
jgi:hypothetical protein